MISFLSSIMTLEEGDLILTGTPSGVGPVLPGQVLTAGIAEVPQSHIVFTVIDKCH